MHRLNTKTRLTMLCLSGFELYSRWVPLHIPPTYEMTPGFKLFNILGCVSALGVENGEIPDVILPRLHSWMTTMGQHWQDYT